MFTGKVRRIGVALTASDKASGKLRSVEAAGDDVADSMGDTEASAASLRNKFLGAAAATGALAGAMGALTRQHGETEQTFARMQVVAGATDEKMQRLRQTALQIGKDLPISLGQASSAMEQLAFSGFEAEEAIAAAQGVADLAVASSLNMAGAARTTASALRMFGLEADQTTQVTASMAAVFSNSATTIRELGNALEFVGSTAQMAGVSLQEVSASLGVMADAGIRASKSGRALDTTLQRLMAGSGKAEEALDRLGLSIDDLTDAEGELRDLPVVFGMIGDQMEELDGQAEKIAVAKKLAGRTGSRALVNLVEKSEELNKKMGDIFRSEIRESIAALSRMSDEELIEVEKQLGIEVGEDTTPQEVVKALEEMANKGQTADEIAQALQESLNLSAGAAQALATDIQDAETSTEDIAEALGDTTTASKLAASQMNTAAGAVTFLKSSFDAFTFSIFTGAKPAITAFNETLANGINFINENRSAGAALGGALAGLTALAGGATLAVGGLWAKLKLAAFANTLLATNMGAAVASAGSLTGALSALLAPLAAVAAPALAIVAAVGLLVGAFFVLRDVIEKDILGVGSDLAVLMERIGAVVNFLKPTVKPLIGIFVELGKILLAVAAAPLVLQIMAIIKGLKLLSDIVVWTIDAIMGLVNGTKTLEGVLGDAASNIVSFFSGIGLTIVAAVTSINWAGIASSIAGAVAGLAGTAVDAIAGIDWGAVGMTIIRGIAFGIGAGVGFFLKALAAYGKALVWFWTTVPGMFLDAVTAIPGLIADGIVAGVGLLVDGLVAYGEALVWFWTTVPGMFLDAVTALPGMIVDAIVAGVGLWIKGWQMYTDFLLSFWSGAADLLIDAGRNIVKGLKNGLISAAPNVAAGIRKVVGIIREFLPFSNAKRGPLSSIMSVGGKIVDALASSLTGAAGRVASAAGDVAGAIKGKLDDAVASAKEKGAALALTVADGAKSAGGKVKDAVTDVADKAGSVLPMSNAEEGPFSNLVERGQKLVSTVAKGVEGKDSTLQNTLAGVAEGTPFGQAASSLVGAIGGSGPSGATGGAGASAAGGDRPIEIVLEQTNNFDGAGSREEIRQMVREATRNGGEDALAELELLLKQTLSEA